MSVRPKQHQLEDLSRREFEALLPESWVMRNKDKDYGIDAEVEIFEEDGCSTGLMFYVQLKATENKDENKARKLDLSKKSLDYYGKFEVPVLLVRYSKQSGKTYCKWSHEIDLFYSKKDTKTVRVTFEENSSWGEETSKEITNLLKKSRVIQGGLTFPIEVYLEVNGQIGKYPKAVMLSKLRKYQEYASNLVGFSSSKENALFDVQLLMTELKISALKMQGCTFHSIDEREDENFLDGIFSDILIGLALCLIQFGKWQMGAEIIFTPEIKERFFSREDTVIATIPALLETSFFNEVIDTINEITIIEESNILETILLTALVKNHSFSSKKGQKIESYLKSCIERVSKVGYRDLEGCYQYNLANHYRGKNQSRKAAFRYFKARKLEADYLTRDYFWAELGGVLFRIEKFKASAYCYQKSLNLGAGESTKPLLADALMFSGQYQKALDLFSEYLDSTDDDCDEWILKYICLDSMIDNYGIKEQVRKSNKALGMLKDLDVNVSDQCEAAFELDMLCALAWFNAAIQNNKEDDKTSAALRFTMCAVIQNWDIEAWINASLLSFSEKELSASMFVRVVRAAYFFHKEEFIDKLYNAIEEQGHPELYAQLTDLIETILPKHNDKQEAVARMYSKDGLVLKL